MCLPGGNKQRQGRHAASCWGDACRCEVQGRCGGVQDGHAPVAVGRRDDAFGHSRQRLALEVARRLHGHALPAHADSVRQQPLGRRAARREAARVSPARVGRVRACPKRRPSQPREAAGGPTISSPRFGPRIGHSRGGSGAARRAARGARAARPTPRRLVGERRASPSCIRHLGRRLGRAAEATASRQAAEAGRGFNQLRRSRALRKRAPRATAMSTTA